MDNKQKLKQIIISERKEYNNFLESYYKVPKWRKAKRKEMESKIKDWMDKIGSLTEIYDSL